MSYRATFKRLFFGFSFLSCAFAYTIVSHEVIHLPQYFASKQLDDVQIKTFVNKQASSRPEVGKLVLFSQRSGTWDFGVVAGHSSDGYYDIARADNQAVSHVPVRLIKTLSATWNHLFHPDVDLDQIRRLLDERNNYYHVHGAPDGHGMIFAPGNKIIVIGDLHGNYTSLQNHLMQLYKDGLIDDQFRLKPNCYLVALGDFTGDGGQNIAVVSTLLELQSVNPQQVLLLSGDHEDITKVQANGFQKEWFGAFGDTQKNFCLAELVWLKMLMLFKSLPKVLLAGLQLPSTQYYDFVMFCHASCDFTWRPEDLMGKTVEKHINQLYKNPCVVDYRNAQMNDASFATGTFVGENVESKNARKPAGSEKIWSKSAFDQFVKQNASRIDKRHRYQCCLCALVRGHEHIPGGIVVLKNNGWKPLKDKKTYEIEPCSVYTCTSGAHCMSKAGCFDGAFGIIEAGPNGHWYITSHLEV